MKKKNKRIFRLMLLSVTLLFGASNVKATEICYTSKAYYLGYFGYPEDDIKTFTNNFTNELDTSRVPYYDPIGLYSKSFYRQTVFNLSAGGSTKFEVVKQGPVCLKNNGKTQNVVGNDEQACIKTWTIDDYNSAVQGIFYGGSYVHKIQSGTASFEYVYKATLESTNKKIIYFPTKTRFDASIINGQFNLNTNLTFSESDFSTASNGVTSNGELEVPFAPNVYYLEYKYCQNKPNSNKITVNYYYEGTTDYVEFENEAEANPYILEYNEAAPSIWLNGFATPKNKTCEPITTDSIYAGVDYSKEKGDYEYIVYDDHPGRNGKEYEYYTTTKSGNFEDVEINIYYRCSNMEYSQDDENSSKVVDSYNEEESGIKVTYDEDNDPKASDESNEDGKQSVVDKIADTIANNPKTGTAMVIFAWIVAMGALGYSVYYFKNQKQDSDL